ncbi:MAG: hypothetical protein QMD00_04605 [Hadesarchaea archaeon]|nr:hypothetical protein [Hadesarchaea archaeon]
MRRQDLAATFWLGYNVGYFCFKTTFDKISRLSEEFSFLLDNLRRLKLDGSEVFGEAKTLAEKIAVLDKEKSLDRQAAEDTFARAFRWRDQLAKSLENRGAFWAGYNLIYLISQSRRAASAEISRELRFLTENLKSSGLQVATILDEVKSMQVKIQAAPSAKPLDEEKARELEGACLRWRSEILRSLG